MTFNCCQKPFFSHKRAQSLSKNHFLPLSLRKTMLLRRDMLMKFAVYLQRKLLTPRQTTPYKSQQNRLSPPDRALFKTRRCKGSIRVTPSAANKVAFKEERQGSRLRTLRLTGELDSHGYRHHPEHTGKRLALFPVISKRSFYVTLSSPTCLVGFGGVCLQTLDSRAGSYCSL